MTKLSKTLQNFKNISNSDIEKYTKGLGNVIDFSKESFDKVSDTLDKIPENLNEVRENIEEKFDEVRDNINEARDEINDFLYENIPDPVKNAINNRFPELVDKCKCFKFLKVLPKLTYKIDIDLRSQCPRIYDQGSIGSCTANVGCLFYSMISHQPKFEGSRMFLYYNTRVKFGNVDKDTGAVIHTAMAALKETGICPESKWEYDSDNLFKRPPKDLYELAKNCKLNKIQHLQRNRTVLLHCLESGKPFVFGFNLGKGFMKRVGKTGTFFKQEDIQFKGSHAVCCVGYSKEAQSFLVANSWGNKWGFKGYFLMKEALMLDPKVTGMFMTGE